MTLLARSYFRKYSSVALLVLLAALLVACNESDTSVSTTHIPEAPDYKSKSMWYAEENDTADQGADVLYYVSTWEFDWTAEGGGVCHYADVYNSRHIANMDIEIKRVAEYMGTGNNFYSPYYRHITLDTWATLDDNVVDNRFELAFRDIQASFHHFLEQRKPHRPFILAGFSQGGKAVVELLKTMPDSLQKYLVAAYVLGYKVTPADTLASSNIRPAKGATDLGVTICYNSVSDPQYIQPVISAPCAMCINPVNWRTDSTSAILHDTITVSLSAEHNVLVLKNYSGSEYKPIMGFLNVGDFHSCEPWLYSECLADNIKARTKAFRNR